MNFEFATAQRILFGPGRSEELPALAPEIGSRLMLVHGQGVLERSGPAARLIRRMHETGLIRDSLLVGGEPNLDLVEQGAATARQHQVDTVLGIGGGSVLDAAKAVAAIASKLGARTAFLGGSGRRSAPGTRGSAGDRRSHDGWHRQRSHPQRGDRGARGAG